MKTLLTIIPVLFISWSCTTPAAEDYIDFINIGDHVWAITVDSSVVKFDLKGKQGIKKVFDDSIKVTVIAKDRNDNIVVVDAMNRIGKYEAGKWRFANTGQSNITAIFYTSSNKEYLVTDSGIINTESNKTYFPDSALIAQMGRYYGMMEYTSALLDNRDNIWLGYNYGEWGGNIFIFNTAENRFIHPSTRNMNLEEYPIFSLAQGPDGIYFSGGLSHMKITMGYIAKFRDSTAFVVFHNQYHEENKKRKVHYVGPIAYNKWDSYLYFYSQYGFFKAKVDSELWNEAYWTSLANPDLPFTYGQSMAVGYGMNIKKIVATGPDAVLFLTENRLIGYLVGKEVKLY
ncbi:MAG: hypothetical protein P0Y53_06715 [Candidatus Pseudobacter hemicellulosilyticus]|uniref:6-bladed beta-propeller n=1 Tax=Candidatus Pseudobacter hemicellulosilyticus TaxID=3121375 RepID=A0AAJ5WX30_9BACT|nr:MAG: hypothetical protein P0Y53_06715 [Pseudobacter sp.]